MPSFCVCRKGGLNGDIINPIMSARLQSTPSFNFLYGQVEVRAKLSRGDWLWPCNSNRSFLLESKMLIIICNYSQPFFLCLPIWRMVII